MAAVLLSPGLAAPFALERWIDSQLDYAAIREQMQTAVRTNTGLLFESQGLRYSLREGIVFNGARFIDSKSGRRAATPHTLARTENLALRFSVSGYLRGSAPIYAVQISGGRIDLNAPGSKPGEYLRRLLEQALGSSAAAANADRADPTASAIDGSTGQLLAPDLQVIAERLQLESLRGPLSRLRLEVRAGMEAAEKPESTANPEMDRASGQRALLIDFAASLAALGAIHTPESGTGAPETQAPVRGRGRFTTDGTGRLYFQCDATPLQWIAAVLEQSPLVPVRLRPGVPGDRFEIRSGSISGSGSVDLFLHAEAAPLALNFEGRFAGLTTGLHFAGGQLLEIARADGQLKYNGGLELDGRGSHFELSAGGVTSGALDQADTELAVHSRPDTGFGFGLGGASEEDHRGRFTLNIQRRHLPDQKPLAADTFALAGELRLAPDLRLAGFATGEARLDWELRRTPGGRRSQLEPAGRLELRELLIALPGDASPLRLESAEIAWNADASRVTRGTARIRVADGSVDLQMEGRLAPERAPDRPDELRLGADLSVGGELRGASLDSGRDLLRDIYRYMRRTGYDPESARAEDAGPLWKNQFFDSDLYRGLIAGTRLRLRLAVRDTLPAGSLPPQLAIVGRLDNGYLRLESENGGFAPDQPQFQLKYESNLNAILPRQDLQLRLRIPKNQIAFPELTATTTPPASLDISFLMGGEGLLPGDLMQRTYSRLDLKTGPIRFGRNRLLNIIRHEAQQSGEDLTMPALDLTRSTDGSASTLRLRTGDPDNVMIDGSGENVAGLGGQLTLRFRYPADPGANRSLRFRIDADGGYVPEL